MPVKLNDAMLEATRELEWTKNGGGIFLPQKRELASDKGALVISLGGTGARALEKVKDTLTNSVADSSELSDHVQFLAVDTDTRAGERTIKHQNGTIETVPRFGQNEFHHIAVDSSLSPAAIANNASSLKDFESWLDPAVKSQLIAGTLTLDGHGAGAVRQAGRLLLSTKSASTAFIAAVKAATSRLMSSLARKGAALAPINVYILTGISGGTGSGTVIDGTYLIRHAVKEALGGAGNSVTYYGMIMLPPTGPDTNPTSIKKGNQNGYAALKEIDYYMSIMARHEHYDENFGGVQIYSGENIFDSCYIMDGITGAAYVAQEDRGPNATAAIANFILDQVTARTVITTNNNIIRDSTSQRADKGADITAFISGNKSFAAPREVNYDYFALGNSRILIPIQLIKARAAKEFFQSVVSIIENVTPSQKDIKDFVDNVTSTKNIRISGGYDKCVIEQARPYYFNIYKGPGYTVNLLNSAKTTIETECLNKLFADKKKLTAVRDAIVKLNGEMFETLTGLFEIFKDYIFEEADILCSSEKTSDFYGSTYSFSLVSYGQTGLNQLKPGAGGIISDYIASIVTQQQKDIFVENLLQTMWEDVEWRMPERVVAKARGFFEDEMNKFVNSSLEDFIIKVYSGNANARIQKNTDGSVTAASLALLNTAANTILSRLVGQGGQATPLVSLQPPQVIATNGIKCDSVIMIPQKAENLYQVMKNIVSSNPQIYNNVKVIESYSNESISASRTYYAISAAMLKWVEEGEKDYEDGIVTGRTGLHMSMTSGGRNWTEFPNLIPKRIYDMFIPPIVNEREQAMCDRASKVFNSALEFNLATASQAVPMSEHNKYTVHTLSARYIPGSEMFNGIDRINNTPQLAAQRKLAEDKLEETVENKASELYKLIDGMNIPVKSALKKALEDKGIQFSATDLDTTLTIVPDPQETRNMSPAEKRDYDYSMAAALLRSRIGIMASLRGTVRVIERVYSKIEEHRRNALLIDLYLDSIATGSISYNEQYRAWLYGQTSLYMIPRRGDFNEEECAQFYLLFLEFATLGRDTRKELVMKFANDYCLHDGDDIEMVSKKTNEYNQKMLSLGDRISTYSKAVTFRDPDNAMSVYSVDFCRYIEDPSRNHDFSNNVSAETVQQFYQQILNRSVNLSASLPGDSRAVDKYSDLMK